VRWGVLLHATFAVLSFSHYAPVPAVIPLFEALVQGILCDLIQCCLHSPFILIRASKSLSFQEPFQALKEVITGVGGIWWLQKHKLCCVLPDISSTRWDQYAGALLCRTHFPAHQHCRCFQRVSSLRRQRMSLHIVLFTVWPCGTHSWWTVSYCQRRLPTSPCPLICEHRKLVSLAKSGTFSTMTAT